MDLRTPGVFCFLDGLSGAQTGQFARKVEQLGYSALWFAETTGRESFSFASYLLSQTERLVVATGIAVIYAYEPIAVANATRTLGELFDDRFLLGLGVSNKKGNERRGIPYGKPVSFTREYLQKMKAAPYGGPTPQHEPPIVLAGMMPKMLELSATQTHGTHTYFTTTEQITKTRQALGPEPWLCAELGVMLETDAAKARTAARHYMQIYLSIDHYVQRLRAVGFGDADFANGGSDQLVDAIIAWGDADTIRKRIDAYYQAGATHVCIMPLSAAGGMNPDERALEALARNKEPNKDHIMQTRRGVVVDPDVAGRLALHEIEAPNPSDSEALIRVCAISLNLGETRRALTLADAGARPGWDLAGIVERAAANGAGPQVGTRVVGFVPSGGWADLVPVPTHSLAELPASVSFAQAATLPVAGLTALYSLEKGGFLLGKSVLVTGASGGVGHFACQLARDAGARVVASVRREERVAQAKEAKANEVVVGADLVTAKESGPYDVILESVGGQSLSNALSMLAVDGVCVLYGVSESPDVSFEARQFMVIGGASLYGLILFHEIKRKPASQGLAQLLRLVADGRLHPPIEVEEPWTNIADVAQRLYERKIAGKAVLIVS